MLGDDIPASGPTNGTPSQGQLQSNQDLLAEIFGSSDSSAAAPSPGPSAPAQKQKSTVDDILGLIDSTTSVPAPSAASPPPPAVAAASPVAVTPAAFSPPQTQSPPPPAAAVPRLTAYPAYDKNELRISLTPQTSAQKPGVVNILARFQVTGSTPATGINFQAAVPKVCALVTISINVY